MSNNRHSIEKRRQADTTKRETGTHPLSKNSEERTGKTDQKAASGKSGQNDRKLLCFTGSDNNQKRQIGENCTRFPKIEQIMYKEKSDNAKHGTTNL